MRVGTRVFSGENPKLAKRNLPGNYAQHAIDCNLRSQELRSLRTNKIIESAPAGTLSFYPFAGGYLYFDKDVDIAEQPGNNAVERLFLTGNGAPMQTDINSGGTVFYRMGVPKPVRAPSFVSTSETEETIGDEFRAFYVYTFVNAWGEEGDKSEPSNTRLTKDGNLNNVFDIGGFVNPGLAEYNIVAQRIYRQSETGGAFFVAEIPIDQGVYVDTTPERNLTALFSTEDFFPPPPNGKNLHIMANGVALMSVGREVFVSEQFQPNAYANSFTCRSIVVGISSFDNTAVIGTTEHPEYCTILDPRNLNNVPLPEREPCVSKRGMIQGAGGVFMPAPSGLFFMGPGGGRMLTEETHDRDDWQALQPETMTAAYRDGQYIAFYGNAGIGGAFVFDTREPNAHCRRLSQWHSAVHVLDGRDDMLMVSPEGRLELFEGGNDRLIHDWLSKVESPGSPVIMNSSRTLSEEFDSNLTAEEIAAYEERRQSIIDGFSETVTQRQTLGLAYGLGGAIGQDTFGGAGFSQFGSLVVEQGATFGGDASEAIPPPYADVRAAELVTIYGDGDVVDETLVSSNRPRRINYATRKRDWSVRLRGKPTIRQQEMANSIAAMGHY